MRIPSQFNEDSLYRSSGRSAQSVQSSRRLLRLILGLALVLVLMRQAARPEIYRVFFGAPAAPPPAVAFQPVASSEDGERSTTPSPPIVVDAEDRKVANALVASLAQSDQRRWVIVLTRWQRQMPVPENPSTAVDLTDLIESMESIDDQRRESWLQMFQSLADHVAQGTPEVTAATDENESVDQEAKETESKLAAFLESLDAAAYARVIDGSVWRSGDFDSFYRYLDQAPDFTPNGLAATGVLPLLQQPDVFRGQLVRVQGTVARAEEVDATDNLYGIESYWQLWLRPSDGVERPMIVIVPEVDETVAKVGAGDPDQEGPPVVVAGRFLKRLAYTSAMGADLAPVVVGQLAYAVPAADEAEVEVVPTASDNSLRITILISCLIGFGLAMFATWRTTAAARDARRLRAAHRKGPDFAGLDLAVSETDGSSSAASSPDIE